MLTPSELDELRFLYDEDHDAYLQKVIIYERREPPGKLLIIKSNGVSSEENFPVVYSGQDRERARLSAIVGGYIEHVRVIYNDQPTYMIVNEEGAIRQLPVNAIATDIYHENFRRNATLKVGKMEALASLPKIHGDVAVMNGVYLI